MPLVYDPCAVFVMEMFCFADDGLDEVRGSNFSLVVLIVSFCLG